MANILMYFLLIIYPSKLFFRLKNKKPHIIRILKPIRPHHPTTCPVLSSTNSYLLHCLFDKLFNIHHHFFLHSLGCILLFHSLLQTIVISGTRSIKRFTVVIKTIKAMMGSPRMSKSMVSGMLRSFIKSLLVLPVNSAALMIAIVPLPDFCHQTHRSPHTLV